MSEHTPVDHEFDTPGPIQLYVENDQGGVDLAAVATEATTVHVAGRRAAEVQVRQDGDSISIVAPKGRAGFLSGDQRLDIAVRMPAGSDVVVRSGSADLSARGALGDAKVKSGSGDVALEHIGAVGVVDTGSGRVRIDTAAGELRIRSGSGDVHVAEARAASSISTGSGDVLIDRADASVVVKTGSGDLVIEESCGDVAMSTGSGDVVIRAARRGRISSKGASGDVRVGVPDGVPVWTDLSTVTGRVTSGIRGAGEPEPGQDHVEVRAVTVSGDIALTPA